MFLRNTQETSGSWVAALEKEVTKFRKVVSEISASKSSLDFKAIAAQARLKEVFDARTVHYALLPCLEDESKSLRRQISF